MMLPDHYCHLAPFAAAFQKGIAALLYHRLGAGALFARNRGLTLPERVFARQLAELRSAGFYSCPLSPPASASLSPVAGRPIWITFDDGDASTLAVLEPLRAEGFHATQFLVADRLGKRNDWDKTGAPLLDEGQVREWLAAGHAIGSHGLTHARLPALDAATAREEISASRARLEDTFGVPVEAFAYPWGMWSTRLAEEVAAAGYRLAFTTEPGVNHDSTYPFALRRHTVWCAWRRPRELWRLLSS